jgi:hypothetical protein
MDFCASQESEGHHQVLRHTTEQLQGSEVA